MEHSISLQSRIFIGLIALVLEFGVLFSLNRRRLKEEQALWWFATGLIVIILVGSADVFRFVTRLLGAQHPVLTLTLLALVFILFMLVYYSLKISRLEDKITQLTRRLSYYEKQIKTK